ncbi:MAG: NAD(P)H-dependent glycerol-3-phosphate dehydrogenase [Candidatus Margulisbacteria bacterium]|nr:NAD(P)H-dependent glycerol-3-phosphate dehydrogenase [Candidatus Margulisiibacteriota bacterium]
MLISIIGAGAWGTTLSILLTEAGHSVVLWVFEKELAKEMQEIRENKVFLPGFPLQESIVITSELKDIAGADICLFVVPTQFLSNIAKQAKNCISKEAVVISAAKGIEEQSLTLPLDILADELKINRLAVLSGPNLSQEIARGLPAAAVAAAKDAEVAKTVQNILMLNRFRVYTSNDPLGVQLGGALKNIIAIAAGAADGLGLGDNAKSALLIRGIAEITRLGVAMGATAETFSGLSGMGDLITTCSSKLSRNHTVGEQIVKGKKLADILSSTQEIAEGVPTARAALKLAEKYQVDLPITKEVYNILYENKNPQQAIIDLMTRSAKKE